MARLVEREIDEAIVDEIDRLALAPTGRPSL